MQLQAKLYTFACVYKNLIKDMLHSLHKQYYYCMHYAALDEPALDQLLL
jgi:hypothetical protein